MTRVLIRSRRNTALFLALSLSAFCARADLYTASVAYEKQDYATAFGEYRELAQLGQPVAQYNLAVMYTKGQGTAVSNTNAHAWASLARAGGNVQAEHLIAEVEPLLTPTSLRFSEEIQSQYSAASLSSRLMPQYLHDKDFADHDPVRRSKVHPTTYPIDARRSGIQGEVYVEFLVPADGHARLPRIVYAIPKGIFDQAVRDTIMRSSFLPARKDGIPISTTTSVFFNFQMSNVTIADYGDLSSKVKKTLEKAEAGDTSAQLLYAMMIAGLPQLHQTYDKAVPWFLKAAQGGSPYAQYQLGTGLLRGRGCQCDEVKGEVWLQKAAQADQPDAQVTLAEHLLRDHPTAESVSGAKVWLERAVKQDNPSAKLYLAALSSASPDAGVRDPTRALALIDSLKRDFADDPSLAEIRAAAHAAGGNFKEAGKDESLALKQAAALGWDLTPLQQRQAVYAANQAWTGDLLAF